MNADIQLLDVVALATDIPKHNLFRGEIGAVVECYPGNAYEVEFVTAEGKTVGLLTLSSADIRPMGNTEILHARELAAA